MVLGLLPDHAAARLAYLDEALLIDIDIRAWDRGPDDLYLVSVQTRASE